MPLNWPTSQLRDLADVRVSSVDKKSYAAERPIRLCNYMDVYANDYLTSALLDFMPATASPSEIERFALHAGDIVITKDSETPDDIGVPAVIVEDIDGLVCGYHLALIRPKASVHPTFLAKQLASAPTIRYFAANATGSTRFGLAIGTIEKLDIPTPPIAEQSKIAEVLSTADRAIEETEALIAKQQRIKTGLMQDLLTRGIDEHGNLRSEQTHKFKDSPLGRIPVEWDVKLLEAITEKIADRDHTTPKYIQHGVLIISPTAFCDDEGINFSKCSRISRRAHLLNSQKTDCRRGDLILHRIGAGLGRVRVVLDSHPEYSILHSLALIRPDGVNSETSYLKWAFRSFDVQKQMGLGTQSIGVPDLGLEKIGSLRFKIPTTLGEQCRISAILNVSQSQIDNLLMNRKKLIKIKTALMQDLLTGKVPITPLLTEEEAGA